jgi:hypothetical protein
MSWVSWNRGSVGPLAPFADGYGLRLDQSGFSANSVVIHLTVMGQLSRWMSGNGLELEDLCIVRVQGSFESRRAGGQKRVPKARMFTALLDYLTAEGVVLPTPPPVPATPLEALLVRYGREFFRRGDTMTFEPRAFTLTPSGTVPSGSQRASATPLGDNADSSTTFFFEAAPPVPDRVGTSLRAPGDFLVRDPIFGPQQSPGLADCAVRQGLGASQAFKAGPVFARDSQWRDGTDRQLPHTKPLSTRCRFVGGRLMGAARRYPLPRA